MKNRVAAALLSASAFAVATRARTQARLSRASNKWQTLVVLSPKAVGVALKRVVGLFERLISPKAVGVALTLVVAVNVCSLFFVYLPRIADDQTPTQAGAPGEPSAAVGQPPAPGLSPAVDELVYLPRIADEQRPAQADAPGEPSAAVGQPPAPGLSPAVDESQRLGLAIIALTCSVGALMARTLPTMRRRAGWEAGGDYGVAHGASYAGLHGGAQSPGEVSDPDARAAPRPTTSVAEEEGELEKRLDRVEGKLDRLLAVLDNGSGQDGSPDAPARLTAASGEVGGGYY